MAIADRHREQQRHERGEQRAPDQVARAELIGDRVPLVGGDEVQPERLDARPRLVHDLIDDRTMISTSKTPRPRQRACPARQTAAAGGDAEGLWGSFGAMVRVSRGVKE